MDNAQKTLLQIITHHRQKPLDFIYTHYSYEIWGSHGGEDVDGL
jgi:hypothetical protein